MNSGLIAEWEIAAVRVIQAKADALRAQIQHDGADRNANDEQRLQAIERVLARLTHKRHRSSGGLIGRF